MASPYNRQGTGVLISAGPGKIYTLTVAEVGLSNPIIVTFDDSTNGSGSTLAVITCPAGDTRGITPTEMSGIPFQTGVYATVTGSGSADITVYS